MRRKKQNAVAQTRCFTYVEDVVRGVIAVGESAAANGESFNLGNPVETTVQEVVQRIKELAGVQVDATRFETEIEYGNRYEDVPRRIPGVEKAAREKTHPEEEKQKSAPSVSLTDLEARRMRFPDGGGCQVFCVRRSRETLYVVEGITDHGASDQGRDYRGTAARL